MNTQAMHAAKMLPNQMTQPESGANPMDKMTMLKMVAQGFQGFGQRSQQPQNNIDIIRDNNRFTYASNPQQQMAQALRNRG